MALRYLVIENEGIADLNNFLLLGVSSSRDEESQIGQFGSGAKHGILIALRAGLEIRIETQYASIHPRLVDITVNNKLHQRVVFDVRTADGVEEHESSMTLGFGELDWKTDLRAMLREFISNALDAVGPTQLDAWDKISIYIDNQIGAHADKTRVFIEFRDDVRKEFIDIENLFLHATRQHTQRVLRKEPSPMKIYRKGVFVRCAENTAAPSLFDYNAGENVKIDESRSMDSSDLTKCVTDILFERDEAEMLRDIKEILQMGIAYKKEYWEHSFPGYRLSGEIIAKAVKQLWGEDTIIVNDLLIFSQCLKRVEDTKVIYFPPFMEGWYNATQWYCRTAKDVLNIEVAKLRNIVDAPTHCVELVERVIDLLHSTGHISKTAKEPPKVFRFTGATEGGSMLCGLATHDSVYLSHEHVTNVVTILEEVAHYYTGAYDFTKELQSFAFNVAAWFIEERLEILK